MQFPRLNHIKVFSVLIFVFIIPFVSSSNARNSRAQDDSWSATVWFGDEVGGYLHIVNGEGVIDTIPVSSDLVGPDPYDTFAVFTSDDNRFIVHYGIDLAAQKQFLRFGETSDGPCCQDLIDTIGDVLAIQVAGFEPDGSRFAFSYIQPDEVDPPFTDGMLVVDAATGEIVYQIDVDLAMSVLGEEANPAWAVLEEWTADGILFLGHCYGCDAALSGEYAIWNPDFTYIGADTGIFGGFGSRLDATGELLRPAQDTQYFYDPSPGPVPTPNVIRYYANGDIATTPTVVYTNSDTLNVRNVYWVADGHAFLVINHLRASWDIVFRDGSTTTIEDVGDMEFLSGSPDGWFVTGEDTGNPALFHYDLDTLEPTLITWGNAGLVGLEITNSIPLGGSITSRTFASLSPPNVAQTARCPGLLPSRLVVGQNGRVTPGTANRMRSYASTDAENLGNIPGGATFLVLEGPACDTDNQIAWWRVEYNGIQGWTAEGQGTTYWTEPAE